MFQNGNSAWIGSLGMVCIQFAFTLDGFRLRSESDREIRNERRLPTERRLLPSCSATAAAAAAGAVTVVVAAAAAAADDDDSTDSTLFVMETDDDDGDAVAADACVGRN